MELQSILTDSVGLAAFAGVVWYQLRDIGRRLSELSEAVVRMEERGVRLQRPTPSPVLVRADTQPLGVPILIRTDTPALGVPVPPLDSGVEG